MFEHYPATSMFEHYPSYWRSERAQTHSGHDDRDLRYIDIKYVRHKSRMRMRGDSKLQNSDRAS